MDFVGFWWCSAVTSKELESLRKPFHISSGVVLKVPPSTKGVVDSEGFASKVPVFPTMFFKGLKVPFYSPVHKVLDRLELAPAQLIPKAWRILVACYILWR